MSSGMRSIEEFIAGQAILGGVPWHFQPSVSSIDSFGTSTQSKSLATLQSEFIPISRTENAQVLTIKCTSCGALSEPLLISSAVLRPSTARSWLSYDDAYNFSDRAGGATPRHSLWKQSSLAICLDLVSSRQGLLTSDQALSLQRQLKSLLAEDEEGNAPAVSPTSLDGLIGFLISNLPDRHPNLSIARDGRFSASWSCGPRAKATLLFEQEGGDWTGVDLEANPPFRQTGAFVINSLTGISQPFRSWIKA